MAHHFDVLKATQAERSTFETASGGLAEPSAANAHDGVQDELVKLVQRVVVLPGPAKTRGSVAMCGAEQGGGGGLVDAMEEQRPIANFTRQAGKQNRWVLTAGDPGNAQNGALNPARLRARFSELRTQFDYLLIDTPPMAESSDGMLLAQVAD